MRSDGAAFSYLIERGAIGRRSIVSKIGDGEGRRVLDAGVGAVAGVGRERIVGAVNTGVDRDRRQLLVSAQRLQRRLVANAEVDAEVHVARIDLADLEPVIDAGWRALRQLTSKGEARSVAAIDIDAGCAAPVGEETDAEGIVRRAEPGLGEVDAGVVRRHEVTGEGAGLSQGGVLEDAAPAQGFREQVPDDALHVEPPRAAEKVVIGEATLELSEVDGVESGADARLAQRRFLDGNDDELR